jgi:hypothetical protein
LCDLDHDDDSFSSQPDDFESSNDYQKLNSSSSVSSHEEMEKILNQSRMSESLLYCLDGNNVAEESAVSPSKTRKRQLESPLKDESSSESLKRPLIDNDVSNL